MKHQTMNLHKSGQPHAFSTLFWGLTVGLVLALQQSGNVLAAGAVVAWGENYFGQTNVPPGLEAAIAVSARSHHTLAVKADGTVVAWGGDNYDHENNVPPSLNNVIAVAAGTTHSVALKSDGTVVAWGDHLNGATNVPAGLNSVVGIAAGYRYTLAVRSDGTVVSWGKPNSIEPNGVPAGLNNVAAVAAGQQRNLALRRDGTVVGWGYDADAAAPAGLQNVVAVACGGFQSLALLANGTVVAWGTNYFGETVFPPGLSNVVAIAGGEAHSLALKADGSIVSTGVEPDLLVPPWITNALAITAGSYLSVALVGDFNDQCTRALALTSGVARTMSTVGANSIGDPVPTCQPSFGSGVWFKYTPAGSGPVLINTCGSSFDTVLQVFTGSCGAGTAVACNDDNGPACAGTRASLSFNGVAGTTYFILAGGYSRQTGTLEITAQLLNDQCAGAVALLPGVPSTMNTADATAAGDPETTLCQWRFGKGVWFKFTPASSGPVSVSTCGSSFDTVLQLFTGSCGSLAGSYCNDDDGSACGGNPASLAFNGTAGTTYLILVGGFDGTSGNLNIVAKTVASRSLTVNSTPASGVFIEVSPFDLSGMQALTTSATLNFALGTVVSLSAPETVGDNVFLKWQLDGVDLTSSPIASVTMATHHTLTAVYVPPLFIVTQPVGGSANAGDAFTFTVVASGTAPLAYQWQLAGNNVGGATNDQLTITNLAPAQEGSYRVIVTNSSGAVTSSVANLAVPPALAEALDTTHLSWTTGGGEGWYRQTSVSHDGVDSARCGAASLHPPLSSPWMQTSVTGPGSVTFYWRFPRGFRATDYLNVSVDGVEQARLSSVFVAWSQKTIYVGSGSHAVRWSYVAGAFPDGGPGYVDQVRFISGSTPAFISSPPVSQTVVAGNATVFTVQAGGTPPLRYQWKFNETDLANATNASLTITQAAPRHAGSYRVAVANDYGEGTTSPGATLTVTTLSLPEALDYASTWLPSGPAAWYGQVGTTHDAAEAAQSGAVTNGQQSMLTTTLRGPGTISFWWKVSSETNYDYLTFAINGVQQAAISGEVGWEHRTYAVANGSHGLRWAYTKDGSIDTGLDAGWLDQVGYDGPPPLSIKLLSTQQALVSWPTSALGFTLEASSSLTPLVLWQDVTMPPVVLGNNWAVTNTGTNAFQYFRLKK